MFCDGQRLLLICHQSTHPPEAKCEKKNTRKEREMLKNKTRKGRKLPKKIQEREEKTQEMEDTEIGAVNCTRRNHTYHHSKLITSFKNSHPRKNILQI